MQDVVVIGGSYAGMAGALQLLRARRKVTVIDGGQRRNRFVGHSHGFVGQDGADPAAIWAQAKAQLEAYPDLTWIEGTAEAIAGEKDAFRVTTTEGHAVDARRILMATGLSDSLPAVKGLAERWGTSVFHCPYCHGYELGQGEIAVLASGPISLHQAQILPDWGKITLLLDDALTLDPAQEAALVARGVTIEAVPVKAVTNTADVGLKDGRTLSFAGIFTATRTRPSSDIAERAGCALSDSPTGLQLRTSDAKETTVAGIFAAGDVAQARHSVSFAVADGAWAGMQLHRSLLPL